MPAACATNQKIRDVVCDRETSSTLRLAPCREAHVTVRVDGLRAALAAADDRTGAFARALANLAALSSTAVIKGRVLGAVCRIATMPDGRDVEVLDDAADVLVAIHTAGALVSATVPASQLCLPELDAAPVALGRTRQRADV